MPVPPTSTADLLGLIRKSGIAPGDRIAAAELDLAALPPEPQKAAAVLVAKGVVTRFQALQLLQGRHKGFKLGPYVVLDQIGRGGMGVVYLAEHQDLHRKVAIKVLVVGKDDDARLAAERFLREARAAAALDHPNIVRIFDVSRHNDVPYLVMEFVEGETLQHTLDRKGRLGLAAAADVVAQAAAGLQHAHEKGFIHRDIKPGNLMRDRAGLVKILDMGLARRTTGTTDRLTEKLDAGAVVGTADFIAPEQALNAPHVDLRGDVYSLGATFFALVTGKAPFDGNTTQKLLQHQLAPAPALTKLVPAVPPGLAAVAAKMLEKKPADRYQTPGDVIAALAPWLETGARVIAGLSQTNMARAGSGLHQSLADLSFGGSSGRLTRRSNEFAVPDSSVIDPSSAAAETGSVASTPTAPTPRPAHPTRRDKSDAHPRKWKKFAAIGGVVAAALGAGLLAGWLAFGR